MARAGTLIGISYRLAVYQRTKADPLSLFGNNRLLSSKRLESRLFRRIDQGRSTNSRSWFQKLEKIRSTLTRGIEILTKGRADIKIVNEQLTLWGVYLTAYFVALTPSVPPLCGLVITALVIVNAAFLLLPER
jgi:hypothetical protein